MKWIATTQKALPLLPRYIATKYALAGYVSKTPLHSRIIQDYKYINSQIKAQAYFGLEDIEVAHHEILKNIKNGKLKKLFAEYKKYGRKLYKFSKKVSSYKIEKYSNRKLIKLFTAWTDYYARFIGYVYTGNFSIDALTKNLLSVVNKKQEDEEFGILMQSSRKNYIEKKQDDLQKIVNFIRRAKYQKLFNRKLNEIIDNSPKRLKKIINKFHQKYVRMGCVFFTTDKYPTIIDTIEEIKIALKKKNYPKMKIDLASDKKALYKKYAIDKITKKLFKDLANLSFYRTEMLSFIENSEYLMRFFFSEVGKRLSVDYTDLTNLTSDELIASLKIGKLLISTPELKKRNNNYFIRLHKGKIKIFIPKNKIVKDSLIRIIKGVSASAGYVKGRVRIIRNAAEISKMKKGEILVTFMTTPDFMGAISKTKAIITNDGGLTCHAAIIAREMGKPCIIGTKIATKVLKDGDLIEVDATHGKVIIIKRGRK
ncbi:MAG: PEP-utilizing enzyme [Patescibacteria group bacterium]